MQSHLLQMVNWTVHCGHVGFVTNAELLNAVFKHFVQLWSEQEEARKEREATEQSLYRYHTQTYGDSLNEDERDEKDILARFPLFEQVSYVKELCHNLVTVVSFSDADFSKTLIIFM